MSKKPTDLLNRDAAHDEPRSGTMAQNVRRDAEQTGSPYCGFEACLNAGDLFASMLDEGQQAIDRIGDFVRKHAA